MLISDWSSDVCSSDLTVRYSILDKTSQGFKIMRVNFYNDIETGFEYVVTSLSEESGDYITGFTVVNLEEPDKSDISAYTRYLRKVSVYLCCLKRADRKSTRLNSSH